VTATSSQNIIEMRAIRQQTARSVGHAKNYVKLQQAPTGAVALLDYSHEAKVATDVKPCCLTCSLPRLLIKSKQHVMCFRQQLNIFQVKGKIVFTWMRAHIFAAHECLVSQ
jgi:hypothetical protein